MRLNCLALTILVCPALCLAQATQRAPVLVQTPPADVPATQPMAWYDQAKHPVPWMDLGGDIRFRETYMNNDTTLNTAAARNERYWGQYRIRPWADLYTPEKNAELYLRLCWEGRHYDKPHDPTIGEWYNGDVFADNLYVKFNHLFDQPITVTLGRQDLFFGNGWLIAEGTPLDASRSGYFDAARVTTDFKGIDTTLDLIYVDNGGSSDRFIHQIAGSDEDQIEQNERAAIVYATNKSIKNTQIDAYFIYKHDAPTSTFIRDNCGTLFPSASDQGEVYTLGARVDHTFTEHWKACGELAGQFGRRGEFNPTSGAFISPIRPVEAIGAQSRLTYSTLDAWKDQFFVGYDYLSGDKGGTGTNGAFDPLWGRWARWTELYIYTYAFETRIAEITNLHRASLGWIGFPTPKLETDLTYNLLFTDTNPFANTPDAGGSKDPGSLRGQLVSAWLKYKFNSHLSGHLMGEVFVPGNYYARPRGDVATFFRFEILLTW